MGGSDAGVTAPDDPVRSSPETAYLWGRVAGDGDLSEECVTVRVENETAARTLAAIGDGGVDSREREHVYSHDTTVTWTEEEYVVQVFGDLAERASGAYGLPVDEEDGGYRFGPLRDHRRELVRGIYEACGTACYKDSTDTVGVSFVHDDLSLLERTRELLDGAPPDLPTDEPQETSSGGYWFGVDDEAAPRFGDWVYADDTGLFSPERRRKLERGLEAAYG